LTGIRGDEMGINNNGVLYERDKTVVLEDFGYQIKYPLDLMVVDFIKKVRMRQLGKNTMGKIMRE